MEWNRTLEQRVREQVDELERIGRLRRFLPPQLVEVLTSAGNESLLDSHRREITVVFCDLRGFTAFAETVEPEDVMAVLREYHAALGDLVHRFEGTLERFAGDGLMVFFNDPLPCPDAPARAVRMAVAMRNRIADIADGWRRLGHDLTFGVGIAQGYATLGVVGFEGRQDYAAIGSVTNMAARLCGEAKPGQILISQRVCAAAADILVTEEIGTLELRGFSRPTQAFNVVGLNAARTVA
jgi:class 3 adenylate cyclase